MPIDVDFTTEQKIIGYVNTHSGSVVIIDGVIESEIRFAPNSYVAVDVNLDKKRIPVIATIQGGRRYLLLPLDAAEALPSIELEHVDTENPVDTEPKKVSSMKIIGIMGKLNSGKDTVAQAYVDRGYVRCGFGDPIKEIVHDIFDIPREILWGSSKARTGEVRRMLQGLGTDYARSFRPNVWVDKMRGQIATCELMNEHGIVIPDVRFINEAELLNSMEATIIQIKRPLSGSHETHEANTHLSETENTLIPPQWITHTILNDGSLEDLQQKIDKVLEVTT